jgi:hypothetical protein
LAITQYTDKSFFQLTGNKLSSVSQLKLFNILLDDDRETKFMNIFRVAKLNTDVFQNVLFFNTYEVTNDDFWDNIAWNAYKLPQVWWVVGIMNNTVNPFEELDIGQLLSILRKEYLYALTQDLETIAE